jgi:hypothetical protein
VKTIGLYPRMKVDTASVPAVGQAGGVLLTETVRASGLDRFLSEGLAPWPKPFATHDPGKILLDLALAVAVGGDALADIGILRAEPGVYGPVASDPTISRMIAMLAQDTDRVITAIDTARQQARERSWSLAGKHAPNHDATANTPL